MLFLPVFNNLFSFLGSNSKHNDSQVEREEFLAAINKINLSLVPHLVAVVIFLAINYNETSGIYKYIWLGLTIGFRIFLQSLYAKLQKSLHNSDSDFSQIKLTLRVSALFYGIIWGSAIFLFYPLNTPLSIGSYWAFSVCLLVTVATYCLLALPRIDMFLFFSIPLIFSVGFRAVNDGLPGSLWIILGYSFFIFSQTMYAYKLRKIYKEQIILKLQNQELVNTLEKNHLKMDEDMKVLENLSLRDELTQLPNRRHLMNKYLNLELMFEKDEEFSLMVLDLDYFKLINDKYGHLTGDNVLVQVAEILKENIRNTDFAARIGGEEFVILLPKIMESKALLTAERIRRAIEDQTFYDGSNNPFKVTISIGLARGIVGEDITKVFQSADEAVYKAKQDGRNRVKVAGGDEFPLAIHLSFDQSADLNAFLN